jgi:hypothetical protein
MTKHPYHNYTSDQALDLARTLKYGPLPKPSDPTPPVKEAIWIIEEARAAAGFNWITGRVALEVLQVEAGMGEKCFTC